MDCTKQQKKKVNFLPNDSFSHVKFEKKKTLQKTQTHVIHMVEIPFHIVENFVGKGENTGYQQFLLFQ